MGEGGKIRSDAVPQAKLLKVRQKSEIGGVTIETKQSTRGFAEKVYAGEGGDDCYATMVHGYCVNKKGPSGRNKLAKTREEKIHGIQMDPLWHRSPPSTPF